MECHIFNFALLEAIYDLLNHMIRSPEVYVMEVYQACMGLHTAESHSEHTFTTFSPSPIDPSVESAVCMQGKLSF